MAGSGFDTELEAVKTVLNTLKPLKPPQRLFVVQTVCARLDIRGAAPVAAGGASTGAGTGAGISGAGQAAPPASNVGSMTPKQFLAAKDPRLDIERVACLAYYLANARNTPRFKTIALTKLNIEAAGRRLSNPAIAARNAVTANYLALAGKGQKQIAPLGEKVVDALPDRTRLQEVLAGTGPRRKKRPRRKRAQAAKG